MNPSKEREMRGRAVLVNRACWAVFVEWTWSKAKTCFVDGVVGVATAVAELEEDGAADEASTATVVCEVAWITMSRYRHCVLCRWPYA